MTSYQAHTSDTTSMWCGITHVSPPRGSNAEGLMFARKSTAFQKSKVASTAGQGLRVVGLATKTFTKLLLRVEREDEAGMLFRGFLAFLDPPKESAIPCIKTLYDRGVSIKASVRMSALVYSVLVRILRRRKRPYLQFGTVKYPKI